MIQDLPFYISLIFALATVATAWMLYIASGYSRRVLNITIAWLVIQALVALTGFYTKTDSLPPRFALLAGPAMLAIIMLFITAKGRAFLDNLNPKWLTWLHVVRVPVELTLFWLFLHDQVPQLMTFEGRNYDILAGITAPFIAYYGYTKAKLSRTALLTWNIISLGLLFNIVFTAVFSAPSPFQQFAFDQPNVAVLHFPFIWLPCYIVPVVLLAHLVSIRHLLVKKH